MNDVELHSQALPDEVEEHLEELDLDASEKQLKNFHAYLREETELSSGTVVNYMKEVGKQLDKGYSFDQIAGNDELTVSFHVADFLKSDVGDKSTQGESEDE